jgi:hypothetical protein
MESPEAQRKFLTESDLPYNPVANAELEVRQETAGQASNLFIAA